VAPKIACATASVVLALPISLKRCPRPRSWNWVRTACWSMIGIFAVNVAHALSVPRSHSCEREAVRPQKSGRGTQDCVRHAASYTFTSMTVRPRTFPARICSPNSKIFSSGSTCIARSKSVRGRSRTSRAQISRLRAFDR
jgi:hypothetical protein